MAVPCRLYLVTPPALPPGFPDLLAAALDAGDVACVQVRLKDAPDAAVVAAARLLLDVCVPRGAALVVNDRPDLAATAGADGVHVGQADAPVAEARAAVGATGIVGVTCHASRELAMRAGEEGADYVAFGAFFPSATKEAAARAPLELLEWWSELMVVPSVAIGGITPANCADLVRAGADFLATSSGVWDHADGPAAAVAAFGEAMARARP